MYNVPIDLTKICIVHPFHTHIVIYGDPDVEAPTLCICNEAAVPGGLLPSKTLFSIRWSHGMIRMIEPTNRSIQDALVYTLCTRPSWLAGTSTSRRNHAHVVECAYVVGESAATRHAVFQSLRRAGVGSASAGYRRRGRRTRSKFIYLDVK